MYSSCITIYNKNKVIDLNEIGDRQNKLRKNGYYYRTSEIETFPYYKNTYGGFSQDTTKPYRQIRILPVSLYANGSTIKHGSYSGLTENAAFDFGIKCKLQDNNSLESAFAHFECYAQNLPPKKLNFINKKAEIWDQGIFQVSNDEIKIQIFYNSMGNYYLYEETGKIINDSTFTLSRAKDFETGEEISINETYKFRRMDNFPDIPNYIIKHKSKFR
jgi:hypothetical protein